MTDDPVRTRIRTDHASTLFVEAGAGTGKTTALVARLTDALMSGCFEMHQIAAITFTELAAAELRDRITTALEADAAQTEVTDADAQRIERARAALDALDDAVITTIHGFAQRICTEFATFADLPPVLELRDEIAASIAFDRAWRRFLDRFLDDPDQRALLQRATALGCTTAHLRMIAETLHAHADRMETTAFPEPELPALDDTALRTTVQEACRFANGCTDPADLLFAHLQRLAAAESRLAAPADELDHLDALIEFPKCTFSRGKKHAWPDKQAVYDALGLAETARLALLSTLRSTTIRRVTAEVARFVRDTIAHRNQLGVLEFDDLLRIARNIVRDHPSVRAQLARRWQCIAVDEFQDTDPLQVELVLLLADAQVEPGSPLPSRAQPAPGRLFLVGDPKQSIYRFRRADLMMYQSVVTNVPGDAVALDRNFRSVAPIVEWINVVLAETFAAQPEQAPWRALDAERTDVSRAYIGPPVLTLGGARPGLTANALRVTESETAAAAIARMLHEGWTVSDPRTGAWRAAQNRDITVLVPTRASVPALARAFEAAGIPVRVETRALLWEAPEVYELCRVLRAIDMPDDPVAVVGALRTTILGCSDRDLVLHLRAGGQFHALRSNSALHRNDGITSVQAALNWLIEMHAARNWRPVAETIEATLRERGVFLTALAGPRARDRWRRLRVVLDIARAFDAEGAVSLRAFLDWADEQRARGAQVNDAAAPEPDDDAVRLMTVHAAKGLEFPIVMLLGFARDDPKRNAPVLWDPLDPTTIELSVGPTATALRTERYDALASVELLHEQAERDRLLYVAATRARDHLIVSRCHNGCDSDAQRLDAVIAHVAATTPNWDDDARVVGSVTDSPAIAVAPGSERMIEVATAADLTSWERSRHAALQRAAQPIAIAATALASHDEGSRNGQDYELAVVANSQTPQWRRGRAATNIGRAVHAVLQTADLESGSNVAELASVHAVAEGVADRADEVARLARAALAAPIIRRAASSARVWREIAVGAPIGNTLIEGYIDLCFETPEGLVLVDYKTDAAYGEAALQGAVERYTPQGAAYAAALEVALGRPVHACVFVFCRPGTAVEVPIGDLPGAIAAVRTRLAPVPSLLPKDC
ncbi:MAG: UvrD-helicase domain-containing protein [Acidimicrobiia bacterium]